MNPKQDKTKETMLSHITIEFLKIKDKEKNLLRG